MSLEKANNLNEKEFTKNHIFPKDVAGHSFGHAFQRWMMFYGMFTNYSFFNIVFISM